MTSPIAGEDLPVSTEVEAEQAVVPADEGGARAVAPVNLSARQRAGLPSLDELESELGRVKGKRSFRRALIGVLSTLVVVAAIAVLLATRFLPVLQVYGNSMSPTLNEGDVVVALSGAELEQGDLVAFYYENKVLVKRVIAEPGDWVEIGYSGTVSVDGKVLSEPYVTDKALGDSDLDYPYQVPESRIFVMGDHRSTSIDSRNSAIGCIPEDDIIGKLVLRVWPLEDIGTV